MKGLDIAKDFFVNWGMPALERGFPSLVDRVAAGRFSGSDVIGADDEISRDHNWGPQFSLFLSEDDFVNTAAHLSKRMNELAPSEWKGYRVAGAGDKSVIVESIPRWIHRHIGFRQPPQCDSDWGVIVRDRRDGGSVEGRESSLYFLSHGALWLDNNQEFSAWRAILAQYPENVWYARLAEECFRMWQYCEYNFVSRITKRGDPLTTSLCLARFAEGVMRMTLLLERDFTPYWKWLAHEFRKRKSAASYAPVLGCLLSSHDVDQQSAEIKQLCTDVFEKLVAMDVITGKGVNEFGEYLLPLLNA